MSVHAAPPPPLVSEPSDYSYETGPQLGKGGFAICHRAEVLEKSRPTGHVVALKIVKSKLEPPKLAQKFISELQIHSKLSHPNIVQFHRAFSFDQNTYVVLELCENGSLADALKRRKFFTMPEIRRFVIQTCGAIKYLHYRNIIHRDLKTGNLFLDKDMNVKVGDFGLAALLVSQNDIGARRTTMCGTPNYLAPEILEKNGRGHNEKVDLWAIGIIAYTLAVGRAPFHAPKREDIYKKLQARDYKWPELSKTPNDISSDLRDLVSSLLVHEDDRPCPDRIVSHSFFKMEYVPERLDPMCTMRAPRWGTIRPPSSETIRRGYSSSWYNVCKPAGVGEYVSGKAFPIYGGRRIRSVAKDCEKEVASGLGPVVPMPGDTVYLPFPKPTAPFPQIASGNLSDIAEEREPSAEGRQLAEIATNDRVASVPRSRLPRSPESKENVSPASSDEPEPLVRPKRVTAVRKPPAPVRLVIPARKSREVRLTRQASSQERVPEAKDARKVLELQEALERLNVSTRKKPGPIMREQDAKEPEPVPKAPDTEKKSEVTPMQPEEDDKMVSDVCGLSTAVPSTDPATVLARVSRFRDNLALALANRSTLPRKSQGRATSPPLLPYVSKWVDYSKKHGVGYCLEDGSIGLILNATQKHPVTHVIVRNGYAHLQSVGKDISVIDRVPFEYYADFGKDGIRSIEVDPGRRRSTGVLWGKFGKYLTQLHGIEAKDHCSDGRFVRFYQRLGHVGIWGFSDGSLQLNFPDHTKFVFSNDGTFLSFTCLSAEAARHLADHGQLPFKYIKQRQLLAGSVRSLIHGELKEMREITEANLLREKLEFVNAVLDQWTAGGGLGCMAEGTERLEWGGPRLNDGKRPEWSTVGRFGGDPVRSL